MNKEKLNAEKAPQEFPEEQNAPSVEQVTNPVETENAPIEENIIEDVETKEEEQEGKATHVVSIEMGFKEDAPQPNENDVSFKIQYKKNFEGKKRHVEGSVIIVSKEVAKDFKEKGIGHIVK